MGFRYRKSFKLAPGVRMNVSKSGVGYSVGGKGVRMTKRARGGIQTTVNLPGTGLSYTTGNGGPAPARRKPARREAVSSRQVARKAAVAEAEPQNGQPVSVRAPRKRWVAGSWYYVVLVGTAGTFAWLPFLHAAIRLKTAKARRLALIFGGLDLLVYVLLALTPQNNQGQVTDSPISTIGGLLAAGIIIGGCIALTPLRRMVYGGMPVEEPSQQLSADPAINAVLVARARRDEARSLAAADPLLARELCVGRPDLARSYDDGGLVDLNSAPAEVIAGLCGVSSDVAATVVAVRDRRGVPFANVDELFVMADIPVDVWDRIRDRAVLIP